MRLVPFFAAAALSLALQSASASPLAGGSAVIQPALPLTLVHHKPGHKGGPPSFARNRQRDDWRTSDRVGTRSSCRTTTETYYDPYRGYAQRQVQVCDRY